MSMRIGIDVDEVLRDFVGKIHELIFNECGVTLVRTDDYYFDTEPETGISFRKRIWETGEWAEDVFRYGSVLEGAKEAYDRFCDDSAYEVYIVSSQAKGTEHWTDKWLEENGFNRHLETIYTHKKLEAPCQVLIDDKHTNIKDYLGAGRLGIVTTRTHNIKYDFPYRVENLNEAYNLLQEWKQ